MAFVYVIMIISATASILITIIDFDSTLLKIISYGLYVVAACTLGYSVYSIVIYALKIKSKAITLLRKSRFAVKVMDNYGFKTLIFSVISFTVTVVFVVMNTVSAIRYRLIWYFAISAYYVILMLFRGGIIFADIKNKKKFSDNPKEYVKHKWKIYAVGGIILLTLEIAMAVAVTEMMLSRRPVQSGEIMTIANATYTFYKMTMAIWHLFKAKTFNDPIVQALRNLNFADACMSMVSLTVIMLATFGGVNNLMIIKGCTGFAACVTIIITAVLMIVKGYKQVELMKENVYNER